MQTRVHILRSDDSELHVSRLADIFDLLEDGLATGDDWLFTEALTVPLGALPALQEVVATTPASRPYAAYELEAETDAEDVVAEWPDEWVSATRH